MIAFVAATTRRLAGLALLALLTGGVPYALVHYIGWPLPRQVPTWHDIGTALTSPLTDATLGNTIVCLLWLAWAAFIWSLTCEIAETAAGIRLPHPKAIAPARGLAALLVTAVTGGVLATAAQAAPTQAAEATRAGQTTTATTAPAATVGNIPAPAAHRPAPSIASPMASTASAADVVASPRPVTGHPTLASSTQTYTCVVQEGDTLSHIAKQWLGDANRWPEIFALNRGTHFRDVGGTLTNPHVIYPGWTLELPDDATPPPTPPRPPDPPVPEPEQPAHAPTSPTLPAPPDQPPPSQPPASASPSAVPSPDDDDDGVVEPPPTVSGAQTDPTTPSDALATTSPDSPEGEQQTPTPRPEPSPGASLGSGSWLDLGLVTAILAAVTLVWAHRRRRYTPKPPTSRLRMDDPSVAPMPQVVTQIRRGLHPPAGGPQAGRESEPDAAAASDVDNQLDDGAPAAGPVTPALANPVIDVWPPAGLGLTGPGAEPAARGFLLAALAAGGPDDPTGRGHVVIPSGTLATLLGAGAVTVPDTPRLTVTGGLTDALALLEEQTLHRTRLCFDHEVDTVAGVRDTDPTAAHLPPMVLITDTTAAHERTRIAALLTQGQRLDIHGILLGPWPDGDTVIVAADGTTSTTEGGGSRHGVHPADIGRLTVIDPTEASDLLRVLAESHTGEPQPPAPTEDTPPHANDEARTTNPHDEIPHNDEKSTSLPDPASPDRPPAAASTAMPNESQSQDVQLPGEAPPDQDGHPAPGENHTPPPDDDTTNGGGRVDLRILGEVHVVDIDTTQPLRGKALELLVYLAARGGTASQEAILEDLLPDAATSKAPYRLHTYVYNLRRVLKRTGGPATYLSHPDRRYILHRDAVHVDLWRMADALDQANRATTPTDRITWLRRAVNAYQGPLAGNTDYEWIEPYREAVQRQAVDATLALADALHDQPAETIAALTTAIGHHPYAETLYQAAMRAHAALGDTAAIRNLQRQLARSLDDIDAEISDETTALAGSLLNPLQQDRRVAEEGAPS